MHLRDQASLHYKVRKLASCQLCCPIPKQASIGSAERCLWSLHLPQWWKRTQGGQPDSPSIASQFLGVPTLTMGIIGRSENPVSGNLTGIEKWGGAFRSQQRNLGQPSSCWQRHVVIPTSGFACLQNQVRSVLQSRNLIGCRFTWSRPSREEFCPVFHA